MSLFNEDLSVPENTSGKMQILKDLEHPSSRTDPKDPRDLFYRTDPTNRQVRMDQGSLGDHCRNHDFYHEAPLFRMFLIVPCFLKNL